jgi:acetylxylan esterase
VLHVSFTKNNTNTPQSGYTQMVYGDGTKLIGYSAFDVGHTVPVHEAVDLAWFGISGGTGTTTTSVSGGTTSTAAPTTTSSSRGTIPEYGQW